MAPPAGAADIVARDLTITVTGLGPENRTCEIDADLYVPAGVTKRNRAPALLATNGFGGTKEDQADLAQELPQRLISPVRVADVDAPISVELPAIVHRFAAGHRLALVLAGGDLAYRGSNARHAVTLTVDPAAPQTVVLPVVR
jgi:hypothetical protein